MATPPKRPRPSSPAPSSSASSPIAFPTPKRSRTSLVIQSSPRSHPTTDDKDNPPPHSTGSDDQLDFLGTTQAAAAAAAAAPPSPPPPAEQLQRDKTIAIPNRLAAPPIHQPAASLLSRRDAILRRLSGHLTSTDDLVGLEQQVGLLRQTLQATVQRGESNSILLVGAKGSGKSATLNATLSSLGHPGSYHHVYVSARQCTTDRAAMRELALQLIQSGAFHLHDVAARLDMDDEEGQDGDEQGEKEGEQEALDEEAEEERKEALGNAVLSSLSNTTASILTLLASTSASTSSSASSTSGKPLIISLDSFDLLTARPRQALLYCLLDAVQSGTYRPGLAIVGMTRRVDTTDLLEKRVKSRFSHRIVQCYPPATNEEWKQVVGKVLLHSSTARDQLGVVPLQEAETAASEKSWQGQVNALLEDSDFSSLLCRITDYSKDVDYLFTVLYPPLTRLSPLLPHSTATTTSPNTSSDGVLLSSHPFVLYHSSLQKDSTLSTLYDLPSLPFLLLIAAKHLQTRDRSVFNFQIAFDEVRRFSIKTRRDREGAGTGGMGLKMSVDDGIDHHREVDIADNDEGEDEYEERNIRPSRKERKTMTPRKSGVGAEVEKGSDWEDRQRGMMAFDYLLSLDLLLPDAFLSTLSFGPTTIRSGGSSQLQKRECNPILSSNPTCNSNCNCNSIKTLADSPTHPIPSLKAITLTTSSSSSSSSSFSSSSSSNHGMGGSNVVRRQYQRVRSIVEPHHLMAVARERGKKGTLSSVVVQWACRGG